MIINNKNSVLLVIDMQNSFLHPDGTMSKLGFDCKKLRDAIPGTEELVEKARSFKIPIIFTQYVYHPDFKDGGWLVDEISPELRDIKLCVKGTWDADNFETLYPMKSDIIIEKNRPSAFISTQLESYLNSMSIENIFVCGVTANMCVETTVRDACQRDFRVFLAKDAIAEVDDDRMKVALMAMEYFFVKVLNVREIIDIWNKK